MVVKLAIMRWNLFFFWVLVFFLSLACTKEDQAPSGYIDPALQPYVDRFILEAERRNVSPDMEGLQVSFDPLGQLAVCGFGTIDTNLTPEVVVTNICWDNLNEWGREILMFHELGHAVLDRRHLNQSLPSCAIKSIMSNNSDVYNIYNQYTRFKRDYYLDELFLGTQIQNPYWGAFLNSSDTVLTDEIPDQTEPIGWRFFTNTEDPNVTWNGKVSDKHAASPETALRISHFKEEEGRFSAWQLSLNKPGIALGNQLSLHVKIRLEKVQGPGVYLKMYGENKIDPGLVFSVGTQEDQMITGDHDFLEYSIDCMDYFPDGVDQLHIQLGMFGDSRGTVYFDDIYLERRF